MNNEYNVSGTKNMKVVSVKTAIVTVMIVILAVVAITAVITYFFSKSSLSERVRGLVPYPAIIVDGSKFISFKDVDADLASVKRFYESQSDELSQAGMRIDFSTPDGKKRLAIREKELLNKMTEDMAIEILSRQRGITFTSNDVSREVNKKLEQFGSREDVVQKLSRLYSWTLDDFENKVVRPEMYREALSKAYMKDADISSEAKQKITNAENELKRKVAFDEVAKKYSDGATASDGGELGWVPMTTLSPEISQAIKDQKLNQISGIIESPLGFHIVMIEERKQEQGQDMVRIKQIFAKKITFVDWLTEQMKKMNVVVLYKGYMWDKETARIEFKQPEMKTFEEDLIEKSQGDASLLF